MIHQVERFREIKIKDVGFCLGCDHCSGEQKRAGSDRIVAKKNMRSSVDEVIYVVVKFCRDTLFQGEAVRWACSSYVLPLSLSCMWMESHARISTQRERNQR